MALAQRRWAAELLHFWFSELTSQDWWGGSDEVDAICEERFRRELEALSFCAPREFTTSPTMALAAVLLFDQIPRNVFRGTPRAFATDPLACKITHRALDKGYHHALPTRQAVFLAMPLMHAEDILSQQRSLEIFRSLKGGSNFSFARSHYRMIARFGRFPHRNATLGRTSTAAEKRAVDAGFAW